jgi:Na+-transporting NADH:ubiquinone oxidoreductase subunit NqrA
MNNNTVSCYFSYQTATNSVLTGLSCQKQDQYLRFITHGISILSDHKFGKAYHDAKKRKDKTNLKNSAINAKKKEIQLKIVN